MPLSEVSKLAVDLCKRLGIPFCYGKGYATLRGIPLNETLNAEPYLFDSEDQPTININKE